jgi:hypothetical protein
MYVSYDKGQSQQACHITLLCDTHYVGCKKINMIHHTSKAHMMYLRNKIEGDVILGPFYTIAKVLVSTWSCEGS